MRGNIWEQHCRANKKPVTLQKPPGDFNISASVYECDFVVPLASDGTWWALQQFRLHLYWCSPSAPEATFSSSNTANVTHVRYLP